MIKISDEAIIYAANNSRSASEAARMLGINYKTYRSHAERLGVFHTNQSLKGISKPHSRSHTVNDNAFKCINNQTAYWLGFIAADGSIVNNSLRVMLQAADSEVLYNLLRFLESDYNVGFCKSHYTDENGTHYFDACYIKIVSDEIVNDLNKYGIVQGKKYKDIDFLAYIPDAYKLDFLIGFFDGDGGIAVHKGRKSFNIACNKKLSLSIQRLLSSLNIVYTVNTRESIDVIFLSNRNSINKLSQIYIQKSNIYHVLSRKLKLILLSME